MRTFELDVLCCPRCSGRLRLVALMAEPNEIRRYLRALGEPTERSKVAPATRDTSPRFMHRPLGNERATKPRLVTPPNRLEVVDHSPNVPANGSRPPCTPVRGSPRRRASFTGARLLLLTRRKRTTEGLAAGEPLAGRSATRATPRRELALRSFGGLVRCGDLWRPLRAALSGKEREDAQGRQNRSERDDGATRIVDYRHHGTVLRGPWPNEPRWRGAKSRSRREDAPARPAASTASDPCAS